MEKDRINEVYKEVYSSKTFKRIADTYNLYDKKVLDMGCGYGAYMQRFGSDSVGITTTQHEVDYGAEVGRNIVFGNVELLEESLDASNSFDAFWANNLFEHLLSPHSFLINLKRFAKNNALLILGVPMIPKISSLMKLRKFSGALASPHVNFFCKESFQLTVERAGWSVVTLRSFSFSSSLLDQTTALIAPHLYLIAKNNNNFQYPPKKINEWADHEHYKNLLEIVSKQHRDQVALISV